jgi:Transcription-repair coupling factor (superfamily II helicase)
MNTREILQHQLQVEGTSDFLTHLGGSKWIHTKGLYGSGISMLMAAVFTQNQRPLLVIAPSKEEALYLKSDLENLLAGQTIHFLPDSFVKTYRSEREHAMQVQERIETLNALRKNPRRIVVSYGSAIAEHVVEKTELESNTFEISTGQNLDIDFLTEFLYANGFEREDFVIDPGQFSIRGGILDLFSFAHEYPFRLELDGDIIDNIRAFDVNTQLSIKEIAPLLLGAESESTAH